jgi:sphinganine C4-monooxygenase
MAIANTTLDQLPPLPEYTLRPVEPLVLGMPDKFFLLLTPIIGYWVLSVLFHLIDVYELFPQYRLHTPAEVLSRNRVTRYEVFRDVLIQQVVQTIFGVGMGMLEPDNMTGMEDYDVSVWATRLRLAQRWLPNILAVVGLDAAGLSTKASQSGHSILAGVLAGGRYSGLTETIMVEGIESSVPVFAAWELFAAKAIYYALIPSLQFAVAIIIVDTWEYFLHRAMHMNKYLYSKSDPLLHLDADD